MPIESSRRRGAQARRRGAQARKPAEYGRRILRSEARRTIAALLSLVMLLIVLGLNVGFRTQTFVGAEIAAIVLVLIAYPRVDKRLERRARGVEGEQHVGAILDSLTSEGWFALHDVCLGRGNIDHIVVGPAGVTTLETKSHRGPIMSTRLDIRWLKQAYAEGKALEALVGVPVEPLLVFSQAYVVGKPVFRRRGVVVLPARMLAEHLSRRKACHSAEEVQALYMRVLSAVDAWGRG